jgi:hypothetical protein
MTISSIPEEQTMKYLCLVYFEPKIWDVISEKESEALTEESLAYDQKLMQDGLFLAAEALDSIHSATSVRVRDGKVSTTDGPFAETKEVLGGFVLIEARDLNQAIQAAAGIPLARWGCIEVRPILSLAPQADQG